MSVCVRSCLCVLLSACVLMRARACMCNCTRRGGGSSCLNGFFRLLLLLLERSVYCLSQPPCPSPPSPLSLFPSCPGLTRPFGSLNSSHLHHAQLKVLAFDYIAVLEDDEHSDAVFRWGGRDAGGGGGVKWCVGVLADGLGGGGVGNALFGEWLGWLLVRCVCVACALSLTVLTTQNHCSSEWCSACVCVWLWLWLCVVCCVSAYV